MKALWIISTLFLSMAADAESLDNEAVISRTSQILGSGSAYGMCDGNMGWYCLGQVKQRAHEDAIADADRQCSYQNGHLQSYSATCNDLCSPFDIPSGSPLQNVSCQANCSVTCELAD